MTVRGQTMPRDGMEIAPPVKAVRRKRADRYLLTTEGMPASGPIGGDADETGADRRMPASAAVPLSQTIAELRELQKTRQFCIKSQSRCDRSVESFIARFVGYKNDLDAKQRKEMFKRAASIRNVMEKAFEAAKKPGGSLVIPPIVPEPTVHIIGISAEARAAWDNHRTRTENEMRRIAKTLTVYPWVKEIKGLGDLGLGIIIGETGDLSNYATKERVWKRLGLAVIEGERQQRRSNVEQAAAHGYSPKRRAEIWTLADSMFKHQWRGAKEDQEARATGPYGLIYAARKAHTATREGWTLAHRDADARRIMMKAVVADLWAAWRDV